MTFGPIAIQFRTQPTVLVLQSRHIPGRSRGQANNDEDDDYADSHQETEDTQQDDFLCSQAKHCEHEIPLGRGEKASTL